MYFVVRALNHLTTERKRDESLAIRNTCEGLNLRMSNPKKRLLKALKIESSSQRSPELRKKTERKLQSEFSIFQKCLLTDRWMN